MPSSIGRYFHIPSDDQRGDLINMAKQGIVLVVMGTRPEAIKLAPVIDRLRLGGELKTIVCATAQHRQMLAQALAVFGIRPEYDLNVMKDDQSPLQVAGAIFERLSVVLEKERPHCLIVQGDTTTTFAASWTAFHHRIPVAHVEAGLRTGDKNQPFPEELNRRLVGQIAELHFAPTKRAVANLKHEGVNPEKIILTGNTIVDALLKILKSPAKKVDPQLAGLDGRIVTITVHRRENFGSPLERICAAIGELEKRYDDVNFVVCVHPNPSVRETLQKRFRQRERVVPVDPLDYVTFIHLMKRSTLILSDSGGIQEEAPTVGTPVLVLRDVTERPEAIDSGWARLVGTDPHRIFVEASSLLNSDKQRRGRKLVNPFGDGRASERIVSAVKRVFGFG